MEVGNRILAALAILLCFFSMLNASRLLSDGDYNCVYTLYVRTSTAIKAGTDSIISTSLYTKSGNGILISDLEAWGGVMEEGHDYYERGNLDIFTGRGPCLDGPICSLVLVSDGTGPGHGWYCNYVEVTSTGPHINCADQLFTVEKWIATDRSPYNLTAEVDNCDSSDSALARRRSTHLIPIDLVPQVDSS